MMSYDQKEDSIPDVIDDVLEALHDAKGSLLCADEAGVDHIAVQHFCLAIDALNTAEHNLKLAQLHHRRALTSR